MRRAVLIVSFGTSHEDARVRSLDRILEDIKAVADDTSVYQAYTSGMILKELSKNGVFIPSVEEAVRQILAEGARELYVVPTHMIPGMEYRKMLDVLEEYRSRFAKLDVSATVLEEQSDCGKLVPVLQGMFRFKPDVEYVLMGHGTQADANIRYEQMNAEFIMAGLSNVRIASVEAKPDIEDVLRQLEKIKHQRHVSKVIVQPFMVVAGDHAKNDMAGEGDSYVAKLEDAGFRVEAVIKGLGEYSQFRKIYVDKLKEIM